MTEAGTGPPPIPEWLAHLPTVGGLVVPWVTPRKANGQWLLGRAADELMRHALEDRRCGVCGLPLDKRRLVLLMRPTDLAEERSFEAGMHPVCATYTIDACPMVAGRMEHYRSTLPKLDDTMLHGVDTAERLGGSAPPWFAVWLREYRVITDRGKLAASYAGTEPLRVRPVGRVGNALAALKKLMLGDDIDSTIDDTDTGEGTS